MDKRGDIAAEYLWFIPRIALVGFVVVCIGILVFSYVGRDFKTYGLEGDILFSRLLYSEDCLAYQKDGRTYPGIVNIDFFDKVNLDECIVLSDKDSLSIKLGDIKSKVFNKEVFNLNRLKCSVKKHPNLGCYERKFPVLFYEGDNLVNSFLEVYLIRQNE